MTELGGRPGAGWQCTPTLQQQITSRIERGPSHTRNESPGSSLWPLQYLVPNPASQGDGMQIGLLLYKAKALRKLGVLCGARETLTSALRRKKDRPEESLQALPYERALVYQKLGWEKRYRKAL